MLSVQAFFNTGFAYLLTFPAMGPMLRSSTHNNLLRLPLTLTFMTFLQLQSSNWMVESKQFHEIMTQPAPHGSYLRRSLKEHFPVWWEQTSAQMHANGYSLPEMNEYDRATKMPKSHTRFDNQRF